MPNHAGNNEGGEILVNQGSFRFILVAAQLWISYSILLLVDAEFISYAYSLYCHLHASDLDN